MCGQNTHADKQHRHVWSDSAIDGSACSDEVCTGGVTIDVSVIAVAERDMRGVVRSEGRVWEGGCATVEDSIEGMGDGVAGGRYHCEQSRTICVRRSWSSVDREGAEDECEFGCVCVCLCVA